MKLFCCGYCAALLTYARLCALIKIRPTCPTCGRCPLKEFSEVIKFNCRTCPPATKDHAEAQYKRIYQLIAGGVPQDKISMACCGKVGLGSRSFYKKATLGMRDDNLPIFIKANDYIMGKLKIAEQDHQDMPAQNKPFPMVKDFEKLIRQGEYVMGDIAIKRGENLINIDISRGLSGIIVRVKTHEIIETFMSIISQGQVKPLTDYDNTWTSLDPKKPLEVYDFNHALEADDYTINACGGDLYQGKSLNLSFLRLKGISVGDGMAFKLTFPINKAQFKQIEALLIQAVTNFYKDFIKPMDISISISAS